MTSQWDGIKLECPPILNTVLGVSNMGSIRIVDVPTSPKDFVIRQAVGILQCVEPIAPTDSKFVSKIRVIRTR